jgi:uncharacterized protein
MESEMRAMDSSIPGEFWDAIEQFNSRQFYACHDTLEALWMEAPEPDRKFYQGVLQIAVACYHLSNQNVRGAVMLLGEGISRLSTYPNHYSGIQVFDLLAESTELLKSLQRLAFEGEPTSPNRFTDLILPTIVQLRSQEGE